MKKETFFIIDGNALIHRFWHAIPAFMTSDGRLVNAVYGFAQTIERIKDEFQPEYCAVAWDLPKKTFRHEAFEEYKGHRTKKEPELYAQIPWIQELLKEYHVPSLSMEGYEADDIIGTLAKKYGKEGMDVRILTGDMDALQLVNEHIHVVGFVKGISETKIYDPEAVKEKMGVRPDQVTSLKALMGDSSDNIPGIAGIGKKRALDLVREFDSVEGIVEAIKEERIPDNLKKKLDGQEKNLEKMLYLVTIVIDMDIDFSLEEAVLKDPNPEKTLALFREYGFRRLIKKYEGQDQSVAEVTKKGKEIALEKLKTRGKPIFVYFEEKPEDLFGGTMGVLALAVGDQYAQVNSIGEKEKQLVKGLLEESSEVVGFELKQLMHVLGEIQAPMFDLGIAGYLLSSADRNFDYDTLVTRYLSVKPTLKSQLDAYFPQMQKLTVVVKERLEAEKMIELSLELEMPLISVLYKMEKQGIQVDTAYLEQLSHFFDKQITELKKTIQTLAGEEFNINSPSQLARILFEVLGLPTKGIKKTKTGYSTAAPELEKLYDKHEIVGHISIYREVAKLQSTYVEALPKLVKKDGRIHTTYNQTVAATGRLSSSEPNLQNIPTRTPLGHKIREAFVAKDGYALVAMDYSQFELRIAAVLAKDESFLRSFAEGADIHRRTAAEILEKAEEDVTKEERSAAKAINFGILYGMGARHLAKNTGLETKEAKQFIKKYFVAHKGIKGYIEDQKEFAKRHGYVETIFGRKRFLPEIDSHLPMMVSAAERIAVNMPIQGTQADLVKKAMIQVQEWIDGNEGVKMLLQVHDELIFEVRSDLVAKVVPILKSFMEDVWEDDMPLIVDVEVGDRWSTLKSWEK